MVFHKYLEYIAKPYVAKPSAFWATGWMSLWMSLRMAFKDLIFKTCFFVHMPPAFWMNKNASANWGVWVIDWFSLWYWSHITYTNTKENQCTCYLLFTRQYPQFQIFLIWLVKSKCLHFLIHLLNQTLFCQSNLQNWPMGLQRRWLALQLSWLF